MKLLFRRGFAVAAGAGLLAFGLVACGNAGDDAGNSNNDSAAAADDAPETETEPAPALGCVELGDQVWTLAPDPEMRLSEMPPADFNTLATWMIDNGPDFEDADLGVMVVEWGTFGSGYYEMGDEALSDEDATTFETASEGIDAACDGLGFGFEEEL